MITFSSQHVSICTVLPSRSRVLKNLVCDLFTHMIPVKAALGLEFFRTQMTCRRHNPSSKISSQSFHVSYFLIEQ